MQKRRSRIRRTSSGRRIELSARDIELFDLLSRYRYLRSTYLYAFVGGASKTRFKERLGDLFHEGYLGRPQQQWEYADARCRPAVHELGTGGLRALQESGRPKANTTFLSTTAHRQFQHSLMICETLASLELACRASGVRFITWSEILARAPEATQQFPVPFQIPIPAGGHLVPDGLFGIEYGTISSGTTYRFFALEVDRGTMPIARSSAGQTSYLGKLAAYREIMTRQIHRTHWGVPNLLVLTLATNQNRLSEIVRRLQPEARSSAFLFKAVEERELMSPVPALLLAPWERPGLPPLAIGDA